MQSLTIAIFCFVIILILVTRNEGQQEEELKEIEETMKSETK